MPHHCPDCGDITEVKRYAVPAPIILAGDTRTRYANPTGELANMDVRECRCGWAEDVEDE